MKNVDFIHTRAFIKKQVVSVKANHVLSEYLYFRRVNGFISILLRNCLNKLHKYSIRKATNITSLRRLFGKVVLYRSISTIIFLVLVLTTHAQAFQTQTGMIQISGRYKGESITAVSKQLNMHLNYEPAEMHLKLVISTLVTEIDSINFLLQNLVGQELTFRGSMNIGFINTKNHPTQKFITQGTLQLNGISQPFSFSAELVHFPTGNVGCILSSEFTIDTKNYKLDYLFQEEDELKVKFDQLVLKRPGDSN